MSKTIELPCYKGILSMCDFNEDIELDESKDDFDIAFEKEFGTPEERSKKDIRMRRWLKKIRR